MPFVTQCIIWVKRHRLVAVEELVKSVSGAANIKLIRALGNLPVTIGFGDRALALEALSAGLLGRSSQHYLPSHGKRHQGSLEINLGPQLRLGGSDHSARKLKCSWLCFLIAALEVSSSPS